MPEDVYLADSYPILTSLYRHQTPSPRRRPRLLVRRLPLPIPANADPILAILVPKMRHSSEAGSRPVERAEKGHRELGRLGKVSHHSRPRPRSGRSGSRGFVRDVSCLT